MHMAWGSPSSVAVAADNGLKPLVIPQKEWLTHVEEMREYNRIMLSKGFDPGQPTVLLAVYVDEDPGKAASSGICTPSSTPTAPAGTTGWTIPLTSPG